MEARHPAGKRPQSGEIELQPALAEQVRESVTRHASRLAAEAMPCQPQGGGSSPTGIAVSSTVSRMAAMRSPHPFRRMWQRVAVGFVDAAAGKDPCAAGERHSLGALDHQQLGRPAGRSRTRIRVAAGIASSLIADRLGAGRTKKKPPPEPATASIPMPNGLHALDVVLDLDGSVLMASSSAHRLAWLRCQLLLRLPSASISALAALAARSFERIRLDILRFGTR